MKSITNLLLLLIIAVFPSSIFSQNNPVLKDSSPSPIPDDFIVGEVKGKLQNKAAYLPKPQYPVEAKHAGVEGIVRVQIKINEDGNVTEASIISGPELLRTISIETAQKTRFVGYRDSNNQFIKTEGVLIYTFEIQKASWTNIGYGLNMLNSPFGFDVPLPAFAKAIEPQWIEEQQMIEKLKEIQRVQLAKFQPQNDPKLVGAVGVVQKNQASLTGQWQIPLPQPPPAEQVTLARDLIKSLKNRLKDDELNLWRFNLGMSFPKLLQLYRYPLTRTDAAKVIEDFVKDAPKGVSSKVISELNNLVVVLKKENSYNEINQAFSVIFKDK